MFYELEYHTTDNIVLLTRTDRACKDVCISDAEAHAKQHKTGKYVLNYRTYCAGIVEIQHGYWCDKLQAIDWKY